jgi:RNA polymerase sigma-70 factor (ECF subfamily)
VAADETELLRRAARGDASAAGALLERHGRYLYGVAHALTRNAADAEDVVQDTLVAALGGNFRGESSLRTWLVKILVRRAAMLRRSTKRREQRVTLADPDAPPAVDAKSPGAGSVEAKLDLSTMLACLSDDHREVILLRELEGLSYEEMSEVLDVPFGTVESRLYRAREELRRRFPGYMTK